MKRESAKESDDLRRVDSKDRLDAIEEWRAHLPEPRQAKHAGRPAGAQARIDPPRTVFEAAEELGLSVHTVRAWIADRRLGHLRLGRAIRVPAGEIRRVLERATIPAREK